MSDRRRLLRDFALLFIVLLPYFLLLLGARPLNVPDEGRYPEIAREMLVTGDFITPKVNGAVFLDKPALYYWLEAGSMSVFGVNPAAIRLPQALFGVAGCLLVFALTARFFNRRAAWFSAVALAASPLYFLSSQYANLDLEVAFWISASLAGFLCGAYAEPSSHWRRGFFILGYLAGGFGVLTKGLIGIVLPSLAIFTWMLWQRRWRELPRWSLLWLPVAVLVVCLPWYTMVQLRNPQFLHFFFIYQQFQRFTGGGFNNVFPWWFYPVVLMLGLLPWSMLLPAALRDAWCTRNSDNGVRAFLLAWPFAIILFFSLPASKIVSYSLPAVPPLAILVGVALDGWLARGLHLPRLGRFAGLVLAIFALGIAFFATRVGLQPRYAAHPHLAGLLYGLAGAFAVGAACIWLGAGRKLGHIVLGLAIAGGGLSLLAVPLVPCFDKESIRGTAEALKPFLTADAVVVTYHNYYQDLPVYLNRPDQIRVVDDWNDPNIIKVDNWRREFRFALNDQPEASYWLLDEDGFAKLLSGPHPVFVVADANKAPMLAAHYAMQVLLETSSFVVLTRSTLASESPAPAHDEGPRRD